MGCISIDLYRFYVTIVTGSVLLALSHVPQLWRATRVGYPARVLALHLAGRVLFMFGSMYMVFDAIECKQRVRSAMMAWPLLALGDVCMLLLLVGVLVLRGDVRGGVAAACAGIAPAPILGALVYAVADTAHLHTVLMMSFVAGFMVAFGAPVAAPVACRYMISPAASMLRLFATLFVGVTMALFVPLLTPPLFVYFVDAAGALVLCILFLSVGTRNVPVIEITPADAWDADDDAEVGAEAEAEIGKWAADAAPPHTPQTTHNIVLYPE